MPDQDFSDAARVVVESERGLTPRVRREFRQTIDAALCREDAPGDRPDLDDCTTMLQAIDRLLHQGVRTAWRLFGACEVGEGFGRWLNGAPEAINPRELVWFEVAAARLRARRRALVSTALTELSTGFSRAASERFRRTTMLPLLERAWLPRAIYDDRELVPGTTLRRPAASKLDDDAATHASTDNQWESWLVAYLNALESSGDSVARAGSHYLRCGLAGWRLDDQRRAIEQAAIVVSNNPLWPVGHVVDLVVAPVEPYLADDWVNPYRNAQSLRLARQAVGRATTALPDQLAVFPGDYPGGFDHKVPVEVDGPSASVALAAALTARGYGYATIESALATASLDPDDGNVLPLRGKNQLRRKGRLFGLLLQLDWALHGRYTTLYAAEENLADLRDGAVEAGIPLERAQSAVRPIADVVGLTGTLTEDIYAGLIERYSREFSDSPS